MQPEIGMIEYVEKLGVEAHLETFGQRKPLGEVEIAPGEIGTAEHVAAEISELTILRIVAAVARASTWVYGGDKRIGIEPLHCSWLRDIGNGMVFIKPWPKS